MSLTLRTKTGGSVAYSVWLMGDNSVKTVKISQEEYDNFAIRDGGVGELPSKPAPDAVFVMAGGGVPALNTLDGWWSAGDCW